MSENVVATDVTITYVKVLPDGSMIEMSEEECLQQVNKIKMEQDNHKNEFEKNFLTSELESETSSFINISTLLIKNDDMISTLAFTEEKDDDGYMRIVTRADRLSTSYMGEDGWYSFYGTYRWLILPSNRTTDAMSLYSDSIAWHSTEQDKCSMNYNAKVYNKVDGVLEYQGVQNFNETFSIAHKEFGVSATFDLPDAYETSNSGNTVICPTSLVHTITSRGRVQDYTSSRAFDIYSKYLHVHYGVSSSYSFSWSTGDKPGISFNWSLTKLAKPYIGMHYVDYIPK